MDTESLADNDALVSYLAKQRGREVNIGLTDLQVLRRNRTNWRFLLCAYLVFAFLAISIVATSRVPWSSAVTTISLFGVTALMRKVWTLDAMIELWLSRAASAKS